MVEFDGKDADIARRNPNGSRNRGVRHSTSVSIPEARVVMSAGQKTTVGFWLSVLTKESAHAVTGSEDNYRDLTLILLCCSLNI